MTGDHPEAARRKVIDLANGSKNPIVQLAAGVVERALGFKAMNGYSMVAHSLPAERNFFDRALQATDVHYTVGEEDRARIPRTGPLIVVANHPLGGLDGVVLGSLLCSVRPDVKLLVNYLLDHLEGLRPHIIKVDPFGSKEAAKANLAPMRDTLKWLKAGGCLATFPSGTVSHLHLRKRCVTDPVWNDNIAALIRRTGASVLPVYFCGHNSTLFQMAGLVHPRLRTLLLPRELESRAGSTLEVRVGNPIPASRMEHFKDDRELTEFLRLKTYILKSRTPKEPEHHKMLRLPVRLKRGAQAELIQAIAPDMLQAEVNALPPEALLVSHGEYRVFVTHKRQIPQLIREIGRLREKTFREVGEGSGNSIDLDSFDDHYLQLFMWNSQTQEVVGGYRLGLTDLILKERGLRGIYSTTLFRFKPALLERLNPALELGRSFIRSEYQRKHASMALIWRGIGEFLVRNPRYRMLFGPVSISKDYERLSKDLIVQFLRNSPDGKELRPLVKARTPPRTGMLSRSDRKRLKDAVKDIEDISALVSEIELDGKGVPVLLRHYLKLNAVVLSFNVDKDFSDVIDGLILVDLTRTEPRLLRRFMGDEGVSSFLKHHQPAPELAEV